MSEMAFEVRLDAPQEEALERVIDALKAEGFGVLTRIDVNDTLQEKLGVSFRKYCILGACNPPLAHKALTQRADVGLMLPCNVVVEEEGSGSRVRIADPAVMMQVGELADDATLREVAGEAGSRLRRVADALRG